MKNIVNIIGGIGTKIDNYKTAIEVYNAYKFKVNFYDFKLIGGIIPKYYDKKVYHITNKLKSDNYNKLILHSNCGGFWPALFLNNNIKHELFIIESGPIPATEEQVRKSFKLLYNINFPDFIIRHSGINIFYNKLWSKKYYDALPSLNNLLIMTTERDKLINHEFVDKFVEDMKKQTSVNYHKFQTGNHFNVSKQEKELYQSILEKHIKEILK